MDSDHVSSIQIQVQVRVLTILVWHIFVFFTRLIYIFLESTIFTSNLFELYSTIRTYMTFTVNTSIIQVPVPGACKVLPVQVVEVR